MGAKGTSKNIETEEACEPSQLVAWDVGAVELGRGCLDLGAGSGVLGSRVYRALGFGCLFCRFWIMKFLHSEVRVCVCVRACVCVCRAAFPNLCARVPKLTLLKKALNCNTRTAEGSGDPGVCVKSV